MRHFIIGSWLLVIGLSFAAQAQLRLTPNEASRFVYEPFTLNLETGENADMPMIPSGTDYRIASIDKGADTNTFRIEVIPEKAGILTLPPFSVTVGEEIIQTPLLRLPISAPRRADEMNLSIEFSATHLVVGQPVEMTVTWESTIPFAQCQDLQLELPILRNPSWEIYPIPPDVPEKERIGLPVNAQRVIAENKDGQLRFFYQLIARQEGAYHSIALMNCARTKAKRAPSQYPSYFDNHFFDRPTDRDAFERLYLSAPIPELIVQALPEAGRTDRYSGIVGNCAISTSIQPADTTVGQPMLLTVTLSDLPFSGHIRNLPGVTLSDIGSEFHITQEPLSVNATQDSKTLTYIIRPLRNGIDTVPALSIDIFDPAIKTYRTLRTAPLPIRITPDGDETIYHPTKNQTPIQSLTGIRNNQTESKLHMNTNDAFEFIARHGWAFWLFPPLLWLALRPVLRHRDRCRIDPAYVRAKQAARRFRRAVRFNEESAWKTYLADRLNLHAEAITFDTVKPHLQSLDPGLMQEIHERFSAEETDRYAPSGTPKQRQIAAQKLVEKLEKALPILLVLILLLPASSLRAESADTLFAQAMKIRMEKPDEARPLFTEAALTFEADRQFLNAANSWFFAGENGRALANYRAAESREPFNRKIRESIAFLRAQRPDVFQGEEKQGHPFSKLWKRICRFRPAIRFGVLTLLYFIGWGAFLTARFQGKTIPRKVWVIFGAHAFVLALTLFWTALQPKEGVIIQATEARLGPGYAYEPAFENLLRESIEFQWLEEQNGWVHIRLPDKSEAWLRDIVCVKIQ